MILRILVVIGIVLILGGLFILLFTVNNKGKTYRQIEEANKCGRCKNVCQNKNEVN